MLFSPYVHPPLSHLLHHLLLLFSPSTFLPPFFFLLLLYPQARETPVHVVYVKVRGSFEQVAEGG